MKYDSELVPFLAAILLAFVGGVAAFVILALQVLFAAAMVAAPVWLVIKVLQWTGVL